MTEQSIKTGWAIVITLLGFLFMGTAVNVILSLLIGNFLGVAIGGLMLWLAWRVYSGSLRARMWLAALLIGRGLMLLLMPPMGMVFAILFIGIAVAFFAIPQVNDYFNYIGES